MFAASFDGFAWISNILSHYKLWVISISSYSLAHMPSTEMCQDVPSWSELLDLPRRRWPWPGRGLDCRSGGTIWRVRDLRRVSGAMAVTCDLDGLDPKLCAAAMPTTSDDGNRSARISTFLMGRCRAAIARAKSFDFWVKILVSSYLVNCRHLVALQFWCWNSNDWQQLACLPHRHTLCAATLKLNLCFIMFYMSMCSTRIPILLTFLCHEICHMLWLRKGPKSLSETAWSHNCKDIARQQKIFHYLLLDFGILPGICPSTSSRT